MNTLAYYEDIVNKRESCRKFDDRPVSLEQVDELRSHFNDAERLIDGIGTAMAVYGKGAYEKFGKSVGYNGFAIKAPAYLAIYSEEKEHYLENAGALGQDMSLKMTEMGLAACWQTIMDKDAAKAALGEGTDKVLAAVIAFGYRGKEEKGMALDIRTPSDVKTVTYGTKQAPKIALSELIFDKVYGRPLNADSLYPELQSALRAVAHAQSFNNRQPYRIIVDDSFISLIGLEDEMTTKEDEQLNYGIVMFNFRAVLESIRTKAPVWDFSVPDADLELPENARFIAQCRI